MKNLLSIFGLVVIISVSCTKESKEELAGGGNNCLPDELSYAGDIQPIFNNSCAFSGCHSSNFPSNGIDLTDHAGASAVSSTLLLNAIKHEGGASPMPQGASKLDDCSISKIETWINDGKPDN